MRTSELASSNQKLESEVQERKRVAVALGTFSRLGQTLQSARTEPDAGRVITSAAHELIPYDRCCIELYNSKGDLEPVVEFPATRTSDPRSTLSVPIRNGQRVIGALTVESEEADRFTLEDANSLQALGDYCGGALDRIRSEQARVDLEHRFSAFMNHAPALAWVKNSDFRYVFTNHSFQAFHEKHPEQIEGLTDFELWPTTTSSRLRAADLQVMETGKVVEGTESLAQAGGEKRTYFTLRFPIITSGERFVAGMAIDVTEQKRAEEALHLLPQKILEAQEGERRRVARELHDSVNQPIASIKFRVQTAEQQISRGDDKWQETCRKMKEMLDGVLNQVRQISHNLRPSELDDFGLLPAVQSACHEFNSRTGVAVDFVSPGLSERLPPALEITFYRILQEALTNIEKHSHATKVMIELLIEAGYATLVISDNGLGLPGGEERKPGLGLLHVRERAAIIGGVVSIQSTPGEGVCLTLHAPIPAEREVAYA